MTLHRGGLPVQLPSAADGVVSQADIDELQHIFDELLMTVASVLPGVRSAKRAIETIAARTAALDPQLEEQIVGAIGWTELTVLLGVLADGCGQHAIDFVDTLTRDQFERVETHLGLRAN